MVRSRCGPTGAGAGQHLVGALSISIPWFARPNEKHAFGVGAPNSLAPRRNIGPIGALTALDI